MIIIYKIGKKSSFYKFHNKTFFLEISEFFWRIINLLYCPISKFLTIIILLFSFFHFFNEFSSLDAFHATSLHTNIVFNHEFFSQSPISEFDKTDSNYPVKHGWNSFRGSKDGWHLPFYQIRHIRKCASDIQNPFVPNLSSHSRFG